MAKVVLGLAMSHSPQVSQEPKWWSEQADIDRRRTPYEELLKHKPDWMDAELHPRVWDKKHRAVQGAVRKLAQALEDAAPDLVVMIGEVSIDLLSKDRSNPTKLVFPRPEGIKQPVLGDLRTRPAVSGQPGRWPRERSPIRPLFRHWCRA